MTVTTAPPKLPRYQPSGDACPLLTFDDISALPPPALATWDRTALIRFFIAHQDMKQDLVKKRIRGVCTIRFREHCRRIPQRVRELHSIYVPADGGPRCHKNGRLQFAMCRRIDGLIEIAMMFWGSWAECAPYVVSKCWCWCLTCTFIAIVKNTYYWLQSCCYGGNTHVAVLQ